MMPEQPSFRRFYSHKFKRAGYRYEVALCIQTGEIVWINGPFPCGAFSDLTIFRKALKQKLLQAKEKAIADLGYRGEPNTIILPNPMDSKMIQQMKSEVRARHEHVNKRFKNFGILKQCFRHDLEKHEAVFTACAVLSQISISCGEPLAEVQYGKLPFCLQKRSSNFA